MPEFVLDLLAGTINFCRIRHSSLFGEHHGLCLQFGSDLVIGRVSSTKQLSATMISRLIRSMRGGSQSKLVQATDGCFYVAKFAGNPQGNRTLINEVIAYRLMSHLGISTPPLTLLQLPDLSDFDQRLYFTMGAKRVAPQGNIHLGSLCPVNPEEISIYDLFPLRLLSQVVNLEEYAMVFVFDKWLNNADVRQTIYYRDRSLRASKRYRVVFIDHGMMLSGSSWQFCDIASHGVATQKALYALLDMPKLTQAAIRRVQGIPREHISSAANGLPAAWFSLDDRERLVEILGKLDKRRKKLDDVVGQHLRWLTP